MAEPVVTISNGTLQGTSGTNLDGDIYYAFRGIPYAQPPIGSLRFKAPLPAESWTGIRDASEQGDQCLCRSEIDKRVLQGSENCLYLNVYTRELPADGRKTALKPVLFWIHGGAFTSGSGNAEVYGPEFILTQDVVLVTINYRTGFLGFLKFDDPTLDVPGNAGLKDMVLALKWVQTNIARFSGDPNNVTIFGESAGAAACHYLILSPLGKGLFHRAILQSGCALNLWAYSRQYILELAEKLELGTTNEKEIYRHLQDMDVVKIYRAAEKIPDLFIATNMRPHGPVIERDAPGAFITKDPLEIIKSGKYNHVPMILGYTNREGILGEILQRPRPFQPTTDFSLTVPHCLNIPKGSYLHKKIAEKIKEFYYGDEEPSLHNKDCYYLLEGDNFFVREVIRTTKLHAQTSKQPIYLYRLSLISSLNLLKNLYEITENGVCHADDLGYLFKSLLTPNIRKGSIEDIAIRRIVKLWTNFARNGDPNPKQKDHLINVKWEKVTKKRLPFLDIGENLTVGLDPESQRMHFWEELFDMEVPTSKL